MTHLEPNTLPSLFDDWRDWRDTYEYHVDRYVEGKIDRVELRVCFKMLGFVGVDLERELDHCLSLKAMQVQS